MARYIRPAQRVHRGFFYLDDETVINSLSAVESGKIDEIVAKVVSAREGGIGISAGADAGVLSGKVDGRRGKSSSLEEEIVRTRTRFSAFEAWYKWLIEGKGLGRFDGWGTDILDDVVPGDTVEFRADVELVPLETLFRLFLWFAERAGQKGSVFEQKGVDLQETKSSAKVTREILGAEEGHPAVLVGLPVGDEGPLVAMLADPQWLIGRLGDVGGQYTVVGQVERVLDPGEEYPALRLTRDVSPTPLELQTLKNVVQGFVEPAKELGVAISESAASIVGPAMVLRPIAIYR